MALDPRISLAVQAPNVTPAINLFNQAMQQKRANDLMPGQLELQQQQIQARQQANQAGALNLENAQDATDLKSIAQFGAMNEDLLVAAENGDSLPLQKALAARARDLMSSNRSPSQTLEALQLIQSGDVKTAVSGFRNAGKVAKQQGLLGSTQKPVQFGAQQTFKDSKGNLFFGTQKRNPDTGNVETAFSSVSADPNMQPEGQLSLVSGLGQTAQEKQATEIKTTEIVENVKANAKGKSEAVKAGVGQAVKAFEKIPLVSTAINNYQEAITALDNGANTGSIDQYLPSLNTASKELDNVVKRLGLDVVGNTTFGALSESELAFALKAAIPTNLEPEELKQWLTAKKTAQEKILSGLNEMANFLGDGTKTIADWNNKQAVNSLSGGSQSLETNSNTLTTNPEAQMEQPKILRFDAQGNLI